VWSLDVRDIRASATDKHASVDDTPAGGGPGMVLKPDVLARAIDAATVEGDTRPRLLMSPRGTSADSRTRARTGGGQWRHHRLRPLRGRGRARYRGAEPRGSQSIGDYVLSGGEPAAHVVLDAIVRLLPGIMGNAASGSEESFETGLLEHPQYTRPRQWEGREIPPVLLSGDHAAIVRWKREQVGTADP
jgi:tRNA (guanine37-N1)-methyltransferase